MHSITPKTNNWFFSYIIIDMDKSSAVALDWDYKFTL